ncbi:MAG: hypothetical protein R3349_05840, partial [Geminicoccaceae bacterium]|nr:hypothetical protein [Geminicoccaceae bacterium]
DRGDPRQHYYRAVLNALERLMAERGEVSSEGLGERVEAWRRAYLQTPHGQPVELARGLRNAP